MESIGRTFHAFLDGRQALITGGTSGIGAAIGRALAAAGAKVTVTGVSDGEVEAARSAPEFKGIEARVLNVRDDGAVRDLVGGFGRLDCLVNCAGTIRRGAEHEPEVFEQVLDINLTGTMRCCAAARPLLARAQGTIVNIASMLSFFGGGLVPGYAASKGGVAQLTKSLAIEWGRYGIRLNAVASGVFRTEGSATRLDPLTDRGWNGANNPMGRIGELEEIGNLGAFLMADGVEFLTGQTIAIDGGAFLATGATFTSLLSLTDDDWAQIKASSRAATDANKAKRA